jgi:hypothetical protein
VLGSDGNEAHVLVAHQVDVLRRKIHGSDEKSQRCQFVSRKKNEGMGRRPRLNSDNAGAGRRRGDRGMVRRMAAREHFSLSFPGFLCPIKHIFAVQRVSD